MRSTVRSTGSNLSTRLSRWGETESSSLPVTSHSPTNGLPMIQSSSAFSPRSVTATFSSPYTSSSPDGLQHRRRKLKSLSLSARSCRSGDGLYATTSGPSLPLFTSIDGQRQRPRRNRKLSFTSEQTGGGDDDWIEHQEEEQPEDDDECPAQADDDDFEYPEEEIQQPRRVNSTNHWHNPPRSRSSSSTKLLSTSSHRVDWMEQQPHEDTAEFAACSRQGMPRRRANSFSQSKGLLEDANDIESPVKAPRAQIHKSKSSNSGGHNRGGDEECRFRTKETVPKLDKILKKKKDEGLSTFWDDEIKKPHEKSKQRRIFTSLLNQKTTWLGTNMKPELLLIFLLFLATTYFSASSYFQMISTNELMQNLELGESRLLVHVLKVQQQSLRVAESVQRVTDHPPNHSILETAPVLGSSKTSSDVESDLIQQQIDKLRELEATLIREVGTLRKSLQQSARQELVKQFGEGAIQVALELESSIAGAATETVWIRLWSDKPHTAWTFVQQINAGIWNGATLSLEGGKAISVVPPGDQRPLPALDFVETSEKSHGRYTVTMTDNHLSINLHDNHKLYEDEACVGIVHDGFAVFYRLLGGNGSTSSPKILKATASKIVMNS